MKSFEDILLSFPELDEKTQQSVKGGDYYIYDPDPFSGTGGTSGYTITPPPPSTTNPSDPDPSIGGSTGPRHLSYPSPAPYKVWADPQDPPHDIPDDPSIPAWVYNQQFGDDADGGGPDNGGSDGHGNYTSDPSGYFINLFSDPLAGNTNVNGQWVWVDDPDTGPGFEFVYTGAASATIPDDPNAGVPTMVSEEYPDYFSDPNFSTDAPYFNYQDPNGDVSLDPEYGLGANQDDGTVAVDNSYVMYDSDGNVMYTIDGGDTYVNPVVLQQQTQNQSPAPIYDKDKYGNTIVSIDGGLTYTYGPGQDMVIKGTAAPTPIVDQDEDGTLWFSYDGGATWSDKVKKIDDGNYAVPSSSPPAAPASNSSKLIFSNKVSQAFADKVMQIAKLLKVDPNWLMAIMSFESGLNPARRNNSTSTTVGLIQFTKTTAAALGTTPDALAAMDGVQQLDYVYKYLASYTGKINSIQDMYMTVLYPKAVGKSNDYVLFSSGTSVYNNNAGLDINKDGQITKAEAAYYVTNIYNKGLKAAGY